MGIGLNSLEMQEGVCYDEYPKKVRAIMKFEMGKIGDRRHPDQ